MSNNKNSGNAAAMREALEAINCINTGGLKRLLVELVEADIFDGGHINRTISAVERARRALSAPVPTAEKSSVVGNGAAMREALMRIASVDEFSTVVPMKEVVDTARTALTAPARNCDRFRTAKEAESAFDTMCTQKRTGKCNPLDCPVPSHTGAESCEVAWLFAPAEGETK